MEFSAGLLCDLKKYVCLEIGLANYNGWSHHQLKGHEFEQTLGDSAGRGSQGCCSPWGCKELDTAQQLNNSKLLGSVFRLEINLGLVVEGGGII